MTRKNSEKSATPSLPCGTSHGARRRNSTASNLWETAERLRANALNPENYRHPNHPDYTTRIVRMFIETVEVTPDTISLKFTMPVPTEDEPEGALSTIIPL